MVEFLMLLLVAAAYALGHAREERDRLLLLLYERRPGRRTQRSHWEPIAADLQAEQEVWHQTAVLRRAASRAMQDVVADAPRAPTRASPPAPLCRDPAPPSVPLRRSSRLGVEESQCLARRGLR